MSNESTMWELSISRYGLFPTVLKLYNSDYTNLLKNVTMCPDM